MDEEQIASFAVLQRYSCAMCLVNARQPLNQVHQASCFPYPIVVANKVLSISSVTPSLFLSLTWYVWGMTV